MGPGSAGCCLSVEISWLSVAWRHCTGVLLLSRDVLWWSSVEGAIHKFWVYQCLKTFEIWPSPDLNLNISPEIHMIFTWPSSDPYLTYFVHQTLFKRALKNYFRHILYFDTTLDKTGIGTLLVDEDDIKRDSESLMHFDKFLHEDNQAHFCKITWSFS